MTDQVSEYERDLVRMANQIARQFDAETPGQAGAKLADHLHRFWQPSMREELFQGVIAGRLCVLPIVEDAIRQGLIVTK